MEKPKDGVMGEVINVGLQLDLQPLLQALLSELPTLVEQAVDKALARQAGQSKNIPPSEGFSIPRAAEILGVSPNTLRRMIKDKKINAYKVGDGKELRVTTAQIEIYRSRNAR